MITCSYIGLIRAKLLANLQEHILFIHHKIMCYRQHHIMNINIYKSSLTVLNFLLCCLPHFSCLCTPILLSVNYLPCLCSVFFLLSYQALYMLQGFSVFCLFLIVLSLKTSELAPNSRDL